MKSLRLKLAAGLILSITIVFALLWMAASHSIRLLVEEQMSTRLKHDSENLLARIQFSDSGELILRESDIDSIYLRPFSGHYFVIQSGQSRILSRSLWDNDLLIPADNVHQTGQTRLQGPQDQQLLVLQNNYRKQGHILTIVVAEDLTVIEAQISDFRQWFGVVALVVLALLVFLQVFIIGYSLRSLRRTRQQVSELEAGKRKQLDEDVPVELQPLVQEVNRLLLRISERLQRSRNALGDLAHALKKPLTVLSQLGHNECIRGCDEARQQLDYQCGEMQRSLNHVLKRARLAGEGPAITQFSLIHDLEPLLDTLGRMYPDRTITPDLDLNGHELLPFDREDMMELLGNILDNACKWARKNIHLSVEIQDTARFCIQDDGPGISEQAMRTLTARGKRLDESTHGHGLGLAIVRDIIQQYHGDISIMSSSLYEQGLRIDISLPLEQVA